MTDAMQLHAAPLPGVSLVEIADDYRVLIEHHQGVMKYERNEICIQVKFGCIVVCGCDLTLMQMTKAQLVITGRIDGIYFKRREIR